MTNPTPRPSEQRMIPCPEYCGDQTVFCGTCHVYGHDYNAGTIPDRRRETPNDRAMESLHGIYQEAVEVVYHGKRVPERLTGLDRLDAAMIAYENIFREEAERER